MAIKSKISPVSEADKEKYLDIAKTKAAKFGVPLKVVAGVIAQESRFDPRSYRWDENRAADRSFGLMQLTIPTAQEMADKLYGRGKVAITPGVLYNPTNNIELGTYYLRQQYDRFGRDWSNAVSAYNAGRPISGNVGTYVAKVFTKGSMLAGPIGLISILIGGAIAWIIYRRMEKGI